MRLLFQAGFYHDLCRKFASKSDEKSMKIVLAPRRKHVFSKIVFSLMREFFNGFGMTGSAASAGRSMGGLFLEVYFKEVGGPGGGGGRDRTSVGAVADDGKRCKCWTFYERSVS